METESAVTNRIFHLSYLLGKAWIDELEREFQTQSDRGLAIVGASVLEQRLEDILKSFLCDHDTIVQRLISPEGPLGSFATRIKLCYCLGLISKVEYQNLETIRKVRNKFAHNVGEISFATQTMKDKCANLTIPYGMYLPPHIPIHPDDDGFVVDLTPPGKDNPRAFYQAVVLYLMNSLVWRDLAAAAEGRREAIEYVSAVEGLRLAMETIDQSRVLLAELREEQRQQRILELEGQPPAGLEEDEYNGTVIDEVGRLQEVRPLYEYFIRVVERSLGR